MKKTNIKDVHAISKVNLTVNKTELAIIIGLLAGSLNRKEFLEVVNKMYTKVDKKKFVECLNGMVGESEEEISDLLAHSLSAMSIFLD